MRALAHPLRLELQQIVGRSGRITTADAARELGISHGLASHHLHQLAKYGFVEQVVGADRRERPWRLVATSISHAGLDQKPGGAAAVEIYEQVGAERTLESFLDWQDRRARWAAGWREHSGFGRSTVYLTEDEMAGLVTAFEKLITDYTERRPLDDLSSRPPGAVPVEFSLFVVPCEPTSAGH
jgi:predicted ArsR family transcriptional regulator